MLSNVFFHTVFSGRGLVIIFLLNLEELLCKSEWLFWEWGWKRTKYHLFTLWTIWWKHHGFHFCTFACSAGTNISFSSQEIVAIPLLFNRSYWKPTTCETLLTAIGITFKKMGKNGAYMLVAGERGRWNQYNKSIVIRAMKKMEWWGRLL